MTYVAEHVMASIVAGEGLRAHRTLGQRACFVKAHHVHSSTTLERFRKHEHDACLAQPLASHNHNQHHHCG